MSVVAHLEGHLGLIQGGYRSTDVPGLQVVRFADRPFSRVVTLATLGLSKHVLSMPSGREVRQELVFCVHEDQLLDRLALMLLHVGETILREHRAVLRGEVVDLGGRLVPNSSARAVYASVPVVFDDDFAVCGDTDPPTVIAWMFPILPTEQQKVLHGGWDAFEDLLEAADPDLFDLYRAAVCVNR